MADIHDNAIDHCRQNVFAAALWSEPANTAISAEMNAAFEASGAEIITVALRRIDFDDPESRSVLEDVDWKRYTILPNTAGCQTADEAIRIARMARAMELSDWIKLEVIPDPKYLLPDPIGTLEAARVLIDEGFVVLPYIGADPILAQAAGRNRNGDGHAAGFSNRFGPGHHQLRSDQDHHRASVGAGRGRCGDRRSVGCCPGDGSGRRRRSGQYRDRACRRSGVDGRSHRRGGLGRTKGYLAGRIPRKAYASASSPLEGVVGAAAQVHR